MAAKKIRVMIVDDQSMVLRILESGLGKYPQIEVVGTATDGQLALNQVQRLAPDVIILDMEMPRMNGIEFLQNLMPRSPIPTIVLSALTQRSSNEIGKEIKIFALGSGIGLAVFAFEKRFVGMAHVALPSSKTDPAKSLTLPGYFADTAVPALLGSLMERGCYSSKRYMLSQPVVLIREQT